MDTLSLECWIYGDDPESLFQVGVSRTETVTGLKKVIKDEHSIKFRDVHAADLDLYLIPVPDDEDFEATLEKWTYEDKQPLNSQCKLSDLNVSDSLVIIHAPNSYSRPPEPQDMTLNFWVRGDPMSAIFSIEVSSTETVQDLKDAIKDKNSVGFRNTNSSDLALFKVSLPYHDDDSLKGVLGAYSISGLGQPLWSPQKLSTIFMPPPPDDQLHLIVDSIHLSLQCWIRGADPAHPFGVRASGSVGDLKNSIRAANVRDFDYVSPDRLRLYKITVNEGDELRESLDAPGSGHLLCADQWVKEVFDDVLFSQVPRVVIEILEKKPFFFVVPSADQLRSDYDQEWYRCPKMPPSEQGEASNFKILQSTKRKIEWTRPPENTPTIPVTLLHRVFGDFVDDCQTHEPTADDNAFVLELRSQMSKFFENEGQRQETFIEILRRHSIGIVASSIAGYQTDGDAHANGGWYIPGYQPDGDAHANGRRYIAGYQTDGDAHVNGRRYMILEMKSEVGSKGAEPYCQAILRYFEGSRSEAVEHKRFNFPCLIITLFGPHLSFSGAVWTDRPNYQILSTVLPLFWHPTDTTMRRSAARQIGAFTKACQSLKELYVEYDRTPKDFKHLQPEFPHPRCYTSLDGKGQVHFRYIRLMEVSKLLFIVETDAGEKLCAKFVRSYGGAVHQQCAAWGISPSLKGFEAVPGGWHLVVMDLLKEYECLCDIKCNLSREQKERLKDELGKCLQKLHQMELVHGDVRDANVMMTKDRSGWMLVDFDWSGKIDEVRYPMNVTRGLSLRRPEGALDGKLILPDHDMEMLDYMFWAV